MVILFFLGALLLGSIIERSLGLVLYTAERWAFRLGIGVVFGAWVLLLSVWVAGFRVGTILALSLLIAVPTLFLWIRKSPYISRRCTKRQMLLWAVCTGLFTILISTLLFRIYLIPGPGGVYSVGGSWGDLPLHLAIMSSVARMSHFNFQFSLMAGTHLTYPFLIDFLSGMFERSGLTARQALLTVSLPVCALVVQLLFFLFVYVTKSFKAAAISLTLVLLSGSSLGFTLAFHDFFAHIHAPLAFLRSLPIDYSNTAQYGFGNVLISILLPQRAFQFGFVMFAICIRLLLTITQSKASASLGQWTLTGVCIGCLPLVHTHTFVIIMGCALALLLVRVLRNRSVISLISAICLGATLAAPQLLFQVLSNYRHGFVRIHVGWMFSGHSFLSLISYIFDNFGLILLFSVVAYLGVKKWSIRAILLIGAALFIGCMLITFQPAEYDNIKFMFYAYMAACIGVGVWLAHQRTPIIALVVTLICLSGTFGVVFGLERSLLLYSSSSFTEARALAESLPATATVLTSDAHDHPLWGLAGQPTVLAYSYWLWSYGLPSEQRSQDVRDIYGGKPNALSLIKKYNIEYVLISPYERNLITVNQEYFEKLYSHTTPLVGFTLYKTQ